MIYREEAAEFDRVAHAAGARCHAKYAKYAHATCPAGHGVHLDVDNYDEPTWVHCLIVDLVQCPHDYEDITGAALAGRHRK